MTATSILLVITGLFGVAGAVFELTDGGRLWAKVLLPFALAAMLGGGLLADLVPERHCKCEAVQAEAIGGAR